MSRYLTFVPILHWAPVPVSGARLRLTSVRRLRLRNRNGADLGEESPGRVTDLFFFHVMAFDGRHEFRDQLAIR